MAPQSPSRISAFGNIIFESLKIDPTVLEILAEQRVNLDVVLPDKPEFNPEEKAVSDALRRIAGSIALSTHFVGHRETDTPNEAAPKISISCASADQAKIVMEQVRALVSALDCTVQQVGNYLIFNGKPNDIKLFLDKFTSNLGEKYNLMSEEYFLREENFSIERLDDRVVAKLKFPSEDAARCYLEMYPESPADGWDFEPPVVNGGVIEISYLFSRAKQEDGADKTDDGIWAYMADTLKNACTQHGGGDYLGSSRDSITRFKPAPE